MKKKRRKKLRPLEKAVETMGLPVESGGSILKITILGHRRALIENHRGVYAYTEQSITLTGPEGLVSLRGHDLEIRELDRESMLVEGYITGATYE